MNSLFCRHNRFTADCPICSRGTVLEQAEPATPRREGTPKPKGKAARSTPAFRGPYVSAGPYDRDDGPAEVRLERVPGGIRLAEWAGGLLAKRAPVVDVADLRRAAAQALEKEVLTERDGRPLVEALGAEPSSGPVLPPREFGVSSGRAGDMTDELRVEPLGEGDVRIARWVRRPRAEWEMHDSPPMMPVKRYAEALRDAARRGLL